MSVITNNLLLGEDGYNISRSVRLRSSASAYFNRTFTTPTDNKKWTMSLWCKRGDLGTWRGIFAGGNTGGAMTKAEFYTDDLLYFNTWNGSSNVSLLVTSQVFRDPSAWMHLIFVCDIANATANNRHRIYLNGQEITAFSSRTNFSTTDTSYWNNASYSQEIGKSYQTGTTTSKYFDGYLTEVNFIDGQALTPSSFGETDLITGVWKPKKYTGTYGTNGFYLNFSDNSNNTAATIGKDSSGNGNNWTPNNISVTAGATYDSMLDTPTPYADGGNGGGNYAVGNPLVKAATGALANGNLSATLTGGSTPNSFGSIAMTSGKWYWEVTQTYSGRGYQVGIDSNPNACSTSPIAAGGASTGYGYANVGGNKVNNGSTSAYGTAWFSSGQTYTIGVAFDADNGTLAFYLNGTSQGTAFTGLTSGPYFPSMASNSGSGADTLNWNFGQRPFAYTPPTGFKALNTQNLPAGSITTSGSFTGNASSDGPFVYLNGVPTAMTINGNAVTFATHVDKTANGFKVRSSSSSYNASGSNTYSITTTGAKFKYANAQGNP